MQLEKESLITLNGLNKKFSDKSLLTQIHAYTFEKLNTVEPIDVIINDTHKFCLSDKITGESFLKFLYNSCEPSRFTLEGEKCNESVGKSRESKNVKIKNLLGCIPEHFAKQYHYELYKVVLYEPGDFVAMHTDNQKNNLRFNMIITLDTDFTGGNLQLKGVKEVFKKKSIIIFNPATAYEVEKITSGYRISILINLVEYKQAIQFTNITIKFDPSALIQTFKEIDFKQFGPGVNIWFSHPLLELVLPILHEKNINYVEAVTLGEELSNYHAIEYSEFFKYIALCENGNAEFTNFYLKITKIFFETYKIDFTLSRGIVKSKFITCHWSNGISPVYKLHEINYITGIVIIIGDSKDEDEPTE